MERPHSQNNFLELEDKLTVFCRPNSVTTSGQLRQIVKSPHPKSVAQRQQGHTAEYNAKSICGTRM